MNHESKQSADRKLHSKDTRHIDFYKVLEVTSDATDIEIEISYDRLCQIYHPDNVKARHSEQLQNVIAKYKSKGVKISQSTLDKLKSKLNDKLNEAVLTFNLINQAYSKLSKDRLAYDNEYAKFQELESDFTNMKDAALNYMSVQKSTPSEEDNLRKKQMWDEMNRKHGFDENFSRREVAALDEKTTQKLLEEMRISRNQFDQEDRPELILDPKNLDNRKFNALYEKTYNSKKKGELMNASEPVPMSLAQDNGSQFCGLNQFDQIYAEDDANNLQFSAVDFSNVRKKITQQDLDELQNDDYLNYEEKKLTQDDIDKYQAERSSFNSRRDEWTMKDYSNDIMYGGVYEGLDQAQTFGALEFGNAETSAHYTKYLANRADMHQRKNMYDAEKKQMRLPASPNEIYVERDNKIVPPDDIMYSRAIDTRGARGARAPNNFNMTIEQLAKLRAEEEKQFKHLHE